MPDECPLIQKKKKKPIKTIPFQFGNLESQTHISSNFIKIYIIFVGKSLNRKHFCDFKKPFCNFTY